jgi:phosphoglycolate phosphatase
MTRLRFQTVVFDLDGTLADTAPDLTEALNVTLERFGRARVPAADVRPMVGHGAKALLHKGFAATGTVSDALVDEGFPLFLEYYEAHVADHSRPWDGVETTLAALEAQGVTLAICTNKLEALTHRFLAAVGWTDRFAAVVGGDTLPVRKPDPAPLLLAIERAGGGAAAFVGDSITDTDTARAAHIPCVALSFGFSDRPADQLGADRLIDHFSDLIPALAAL